jgi:uncharacterized membrane protein YtjA (UPF0391 family)
MLYGATVFYVIAIIASVLGFGGVAATAGVIAKILFFTFLARFLFMLVTALFGQTRPPPIPEVATGAAAPNKRKLEASRS